MEELDDGGEAPPPFFEDVAKDPTIASLDERLEAGDITPGLHERSELFDSIF